MSIISNVLLGAFFAGVNAGIVYLSKSQPIKFEPVKFGRTIGVASLVALGIGFYPSITATELGVISVYGGYLIERLGLLVYRRLKENDLVIKIKRE